MSLTLDDKHMSQSSAIMHASSEIVARSPPEIVTIVSHTFTQEITTGYHGVIRKLPPSPSSSTSLTWGLSLGLTLLTTMIVAGAIGVFIYQKRRRRRVYLLNDEIATSPTLNEDRPSSDSYFYPNELCCEFSPMDGAFGGEEGRGICGCGGCMLRNSIGTNHRHHSADPYLFTDVNGVVVMRMVPSDALMREAHSSVPELGLRDRSQWLRRHLQTYSNHQVGAADESLRETAMSGGEFDFPQARVNMMAADMPAVVNACAMIPVPSSVTGKEDKSIADVGGILNPECGGCSRIKMMGQSGVDGVSPHRSDSRHDVSCIPLDTNGTDLPNPLPDATCYQGYTRQPSSVLYGGGESYIPWRETEAGEEEDSSDGSEALENSHSSSS